MEQDRIHIKLARRTPEERQADETRRLDPFMRALKASAARLEDNPDIPDTAVRTKGLRPLPVPLDLKVILIGDEYLYEGLLDSDDRFAKLFRVT